MCSSSSALQLPPQHRKGGRGAEAALGHAAGTGSSGNMRQRGADSPVPCVSRPFITPCSQHI